MSKYDAAIDLRRRLDVPLLTLSSKTVNGEEELVPIESSSGTMAMPET